MRRLLSIAVTAQVLLSLGACGADDPPGREITATSGEELFSMRALGGNPGCVTCHSLEADQVLVGPPLVGLKDRAGTRVPGLEPAAYVRASIVTPDAHVLDGFEAGKMPSEFGEVLSNQQLEALVTYVLEVQ